MNTDIQSILAPVIVFLTIAVMAYVRWRKKGGSCGGSCGCSKETKEPPSQK